MHNMLWYHTFVCMTHNKTLLVAENHPQSCEDRILPIRNLLQTVLHNIFLDVTGFWNGVACILDFNHAWTKGQRKEV